MAIRLISSARGTIGESTPDVEDDRRLPQFKKTALVCEMQRGQAR